MAYATLDDMIARYGSEELTQISTPAGQDQDGIVADVVLAAVTDASAMMDGYIGRRYRVPMDVPPSIVTALCCDMARYRLSTGGSRTPSETIRAGYKDAIAWLTDVSVGKVVLELDEVAAGDESYAQMAPSRDATFGGCY